VTRTDRGVDLRILGPLEARIDGERRHVGGAKQQAVLAVLLLHADEFVSIDRLIDEVWGDDPPASAAHGVETYVSRLRQLFEGHDPSIVRRGRSYSVELGSATLDARVFEELVRRADRAADAGDFPRSSALTNEAIALWRGPVLSNVALAAAGRAAAERLEELRLRRLEARFNAELALGRHRDVIAELRRLVDQHPFREEFVAQLMLALYRSARQAEALEVYERTRVALADELGLRPSVELQELSARIVRQEAQLASPRIDRGHVLTRTPATASRSKRSVTVLLAAAAGIVATVLSLSASTGPPHVAPAAAADRASSQPTATRGARVTLVLPRRRREPITPWLADTFVQALRRHGATWGVKTTVVVGADAWLVGKPAAGAADIVLVFGEVPARRLSPLVARMPHTRFVFLDASLADLGIKGVSNASAVRFADEEESHLVGYLSALVAPRSGASGDHVDRVSIVAGPVSAHARRVVAGFREGVKKARRGVAIRVDYVDHVGDATACERAANAQIDAGSDVVFAAAGRCGLGAVAVARLRGVWAVGGYQDGVDLGPNVLAVTYKDYDHALEAVLEAFTRGALPAGGDLTLGLADDYAVGIEDADRNNAVPEWIWSKVAERCSELRRETMSPPST
jgi:DNA-binding SARP family transcriptional activator/basic membrane lipoprotein Med (substrate-binding protein (PBP1-ABC) superfamily)